MMETGGATELLEGFASSVSLALSRQRRSMQRFASDLWHLPRGAVARRDEIDRAIYDLLRVLGHAGTRAIVEAMDKVAQQRTLQRWLAGMVKRGLVEKTGARKDARYRIVEAF